MTANEFAHGLRLQFMCPDRSGCPVHDLAFANGKNDTLSAPFYDFAGTDDVLYVGDDSGNLHQFTGVFVGNPAESGESLARESGHQ